MPVEVDPNTGRNKRQLFIQRSLDALLESLDPSTTKAILLSSVPHWLDEELLHRLTGDGEGWAGTLETLLDLQLARQDSRGHLLYPEEVRRILLSLQRQNAAQEYLEANRIAHTYFLERAAQAPVTEGPRLEREALYHQLIFDEPGGLRLLNEKLQEFFAYHQLGAAELLVAHAKERRSELSKEGQQWLDYFAACLELSSRHFDQAEALLGQVDKDSPDPVLHALVNWKMGQVLVARYQWSQAIRLYKHSLEYLGEKAESVYRARVLLSLGDAYRDLTEHSGGYALTSMERPGRLRAFLLFCQHFPFLCIEWVVRRVSFLPKLYVGTDYQNWIIDRLLFVAAGWMAKAERLLAAQDQLVELSEARLALANIEHQVGHWSRAWRRYATLEREPTIQKSPYRSAKVLLGQGRASLTEGKLAEATEKLAEAADIFRAFKDPISTGTATLLLGEALAKLGKMGRATEAYLDSAEAFEIAKDNLELTRVLWSLEVLTRNSTFPERLQLRADAILGRIPVRQTITRFPARILKLYRNLALLVALPLAYVLVYRVASDSLILFSFLETLFLSPSNTVRYPVLLVLTLVAKLVLPLVLAFWIYRGIYSILGLIAVYILGNRLVLIEQEQPIHISIDPDGITSYARWTDRTDPKNQEPVDSAVPVNARKLAWSDIVEVVAIHYQVISRPIELISRMLLQVSPAALVVEGSTMGYNFLLRDIQKLLARQSYPRKLRISTFTFLEWRSTLVVSLLVLAFISYLSQIGQIAVSGGFSEDVVTLPISTIVEFTVRTLLLILPAVILWRVLIHRLHLRKSARDEGATVSSWVILIAALLSSVIAVRWILYLALTR